MKNITTVCLLLLAISQARAFAPKAPPPEVDKTTPGYQQLDRMRFLLGKWESKDGPDGKQVQIWYKFVSGGSTLVETEKVGEAPEMITVYNLDHDRLVMTHYCSYNNQPHMKAELPTAPIKQIRFSFESITNLPSADSGHMHALVLDFQDNDHFTQTWTWAEKGASSPVTFRLTRAK
jgi:hypothetical protein